VIAAARDINCFKNVGTTANDYNRKSHTRQIELVHKHSEDKRTENKHAGRRL